MRTSAERARGCGFRKGGGYYVMGGGEWATCGKLPYPLKPCHCCGQGLDFFRGFKFFNPHGFIDDQPCGLEKPIKCSFCAMAGGMPEKAGMMWVGEAFYSPDAFIQESVDMGVSKRLPTVPHELLKLIKAGTPPRIYLAHKKAALVDGEPCPGIFTTFVASRVEYVVKGDEAAEELERIENRGIELVKVVPLEDQPELPEGEEDEEHQG